MDYRDIDIYIYDDIFKVCEFIILIITYIIPFLTYEEPRTPYCDIF